MRHVEVKLDPFGYGSVEIDGKNVSEYTDGIEIRSELREPTTVILHIAKGRSIDFAQAIPNLEIDCDCPHCGQRITLNEK